MVGRSKDATKCGDVDVKYGGGAHIVDSICCDPVETLQEEQYSIHDREGRGEVIPEDGQSE